MKNKEHNAIHEILDWIALRYWAIGHAEGVQSREKDYNQGYNEGYRIGMIDANDKYKSAD